MRNPAANVGKMLEACNRLGKKVSGAYGNIPLYTCWQRLSRSVFIQKESDDAENNMGNPERRPHAGAVRDIRNPERWQRDFEHIRISVRYARTSCRFKPDIHTSLVFVQK
jgi:hypothetical protein